jgi:hypothetical protein
MTCRQAIAPRNLLLMARSNYIAHPGKRARVSPPFLCILADFKPFSSPKQQIL